MAYPSTIYSGTASAGTSLLTSPDHSARHNNVDTELVAIETTVGTTAGTNVLKDFSAGNFPARINTSNVLQQALSGTINNSTLGTPRITGGTASSFILGTSSVVGGTVSASNLNNSNIGTPTILGGTIVVSGTTAPLNVGASLAPTVITITDVASGTFTPNAPSGNIFHLVLGTTAGNRTFGTPTNAQEGMTITFRIKQNTNNTGTIVWTPIWRQNSVGTTALGTQSTYNYYSYRYNSIDTKWDSQGNSTGII